MKKKKYAILIIIFIAIALLSIFILRIRKSADGSKKISGNSFIENESQSKEEGFTGKLKQAILKNIPMKCTWKKDENFSAVGYIKSQKYYGEIINQGKKGYLIMKDKCMWTWDAENKQGVKMCFDEDIWENKNNVPQDDYHCTPSSVADSVFDLPSDVNFLDMDKQMNSLEE